MVVPLSGAVRPGVPAPAPARVAAEAPLAERYAAHRANAEEAARLAHAAGAERRARAVRELAAPDRHFLEFDARGPGRTAEVLGDLHTADRVAILVPGSDTGIDTYPRFLRGALALHERLGPRVAVIAWLGYATPGTVSPAALTPGRADTAAAELRSFLHRLTTYGVPARTPVALLCHSYGSVVCARAAHGLGTPTAGTRVTDIVLYGSPGTGFDHAAELRTRARVWAGRGAHDWIAEVPHVRVELFGTTLGFGPDPVTAAFGARRFDAGDGGHPDQLAALRSGDIPLSTAVEELLRYDSPLHLFERWVLEDIEVGGVRIPRGSEVALLFGSANRDPEAFADPDRLDLSRTDNPHVSLGGGIHYCLGAPLARLELAASYGQLVRRAPGLRLSTEPRWKDGLVIRGLRELVVEV
ncbi:cytochrome P450 [Streptomyces sp. B-S-A8]|uniref:Cytochrome P450 n=1 Tax=Streptomyces solicavernae TaxID=3043614 RepID=A0ABT6RK38_9ACTN|nr:cytochrome P450 [Streptomyces sp. B-S-A8]MDI3384660.1 cytochrome P450 [Streptomyces sp. B-S-A8]